MAKKKSKKKNKVDDNLEMIDQKQVDDFIEALRAIQEDEDLSPLNEESLEDERLIISVNSSLQSAANLILEASDYASERKDVESILAVADKWMELGAMIHNLIKSTEENGDHVHPGHFGFIGEDQKDER